MVGFSRFGIGGAWGDCAFADRLGAGDWLDLEGKVTEEQRNSFDLGIEGEDRTEFFIEGKDGLPVYFLKTARTLTPKTVEALRTQWRELFEGKAQLVILQEGLEFNFPTETIDVAKKRAEFYQKMFSAAQEQLNG